MAKAKSKSQGKKAPNQRGKSKANASSDSDDDHPPAPDLFTPSPRRGADASTRGSALHETPRRRSAAPPPPNLPAAVSHPASPRRNPLSGLSSGEESPERRSAPSRSSHRVPVPRGRQTATGSRGGAPAVSPDPSSDDEYESPERPRSRPLSSIQNRQGQNPGVSAGNSRSQPAPRPTSSRGSPRRPLPAPRPTSGGGSPRQPLPSQRGGKRTTKPPRYRPPPKYLLEINRLQKSTDLMIPAASFCRLVREVTISVTSHNDIRYQKGALMALHEAAEAYIVGMFEDSYLCALHCKRITLMAKDMRLAYRIRGDANRYGF